jgi:hypothetical protein
MAKIKIKRTCEFSGSDVKVEDGVLYIDGAKVMDFPDPELRLEVDGAVSVSADVPLFQTSVAGGSASVSGGAASVSGGSAYARGGSAYGRATGGSVDISMGDSEQAEKIAEEVMEEVGGIGEAVAESLENAFPPGFPFHKKKKKK